MEPVISVIIPCYNVEKYIDHCMESLEIQTIGIKKLQIIMIDDGSTDSTLNKLVGWQARYPENIYIVRNEKNRRQGTCRNIGLKMAKAPYVSFVDADDWIEPDMYENMLEIALLGECDVVHCKNSYDTDYKYHTMLQERYTGEQDRMILIDNVEDRGRMIASNLLGTYVVTKLYSREFIEKNNLHFPEDVIFEDIYWMGLLNCYAEKIAVIEERLYHYYMNMTSVSRVRNSEQNRDIIRVNRMLWDEYDRRNLLNGELGEALRYEMLCTYYLTAAKMIFLRYDETPYDMFYEVQRDMLDMVPDYMFNKYVNKYTTQFNILLLGILDKELSTEDIDSAARSMRMIAEAGRKEDDNKTTDFSMYNC